jgi:hypothetical protein
MCDQTGRGRESTVNKTHFLRFWFSGSLSVLLGAVFSSAIVRADSLSDDLATWIDQRGEKVYGQPPEPCDDFTFARRVYLDSVGRIPSLPELRDFQAAGSQRRNELIHQLVFSQGERAIVNKKLNAAHLARQWRRVLIPPGTTASGAPETIESWLSESFEANKPLDEMMRELVRATPNTPSNAYYGLVGSMPQNYAGHVSRVMFGVRIECAQCHDHPFANWKQSDFWGLAAFYSDMNNATSDPEVKAGSAGVIVNESVSYNAKYLWEPTSSSAEAATSTSGTELRGNLARWVTDRKNPHFSSTMVNRFWQQLIGNGLYHDVENLDMATPEERAFLDELGEKFEEIGFDTQTLVAAIYKSRWYQAKSVDDESQASSTGFARSLKVTTPEQVFDSLEQSLHLPVSRIDPDSARWTGDRMQLVSRLSETTGSNPEDYAAGIPQALMLMNGKMTSDAIDWNRSRTLRAIVEAPFLDEKSRLDSLFLCLLTREPTEDERTQLEAFLDQQDDEDSKQRAYGEILWALLNSPEFVLCR